MKTYRQSKTGFTLIEMIMAMSAALIVMMAVAILTFSGQRSWTNTYNKSNSELQVGTIGATTALGSFGRKSNKTDYRLYKLVNNTYQRAVPQTNPEEVVVGDAVEFHYWDGDLNADMMNTSITATNYVLFYIDNGDFKTDYGPYPPGAVDAAGHRLTGNNVTTVTLIHNVTSVQFSHTTSTMAGDGKGCIRMQLTANDPVTGFPKVILAATLMRNTWP
jgi:prepilin-type N-terminal cleavage/methylation domain-containing protein